MIDDPEIAALFRDEADGHLRLLEAGLLRLETDPGDRPTLEESMREAHSLKGAARMLGLADVEMISHVLEDRLRGAAREREPVTAIDVEPMLRAVDALRDLVAEALDDLPAGVSAADVVAALRPGPAAAAVPAAAPRRQVRTVPAPVGDQAAAVGSPDPLDHAAAAEPPVPPDQAAAEAPVPPEEAAAAEAPVPPATDRVQTIRVPPRKLDALMGNVGELTVTRTRVAHRLVDIRAAIRLWEELYQQQRADRDAITAAETGDASLRVTEAQWEAADARLRDLGQSLRQLHDRLAEDEARLGGVVEKLDEGIRDVRMLPLATVFDQFHRLVRDLSRSLAIPVELVVEGGEIMADKQILEAIKDPLMHAIRNAVFHGIEPPDRRRAAGKEPTGRVLLRGSRTGSSIRIEVRDDGRGLDTERILARAVELGAISGEEAATLPPRRVWPLIFTPGLTTSQAVTDISGRGVGMDVVRKNVVELKGRIDIESAPGQGTALTFVLPQTLATTRVLLVVAGGQEFGIPLEYIRIALAVPASDVYTVEGREAITVLGEPVLAMDAVDLLELPGHAGRPDGPLTYVVVTDGNDQAAVRVEQAGEEQDIVLRPAGALLRRVRNVTGAGLLSSGEVCVVLNAPDLVRSASRSGPRRRAARATRRTPRQRTVLLAEDSATTRARIKRILESAGYRVVAAVDGRDAWNQLATHRVDAVVTDVLMPHLTGIELTERIRASQQWADLPVVLVTTLASDEDRRRGLHAGANAYITKGSFDQRALVDTVASFIGGRREND